MDLKPRFQRLLKQTHEFTDGLLASFETPQQWTHQLFPGCNHALWFAGHASLVDNWIIQLLDSTQHVERENYEKMFGFGSKPTGNPADYPPPAEVVAFMRDRREVLGRILESLSESRLAEPAPPGGPAFLTDIASLFEMVTWHEGMHGGQITLIRRALGKPPLFG